MRAVIAPLVFALLMAAAGCESKKETPAARPVNVKVAVAKSQDAPLMVSGVGHVTAMRTVNVQAQVTGVLQEMPFKEGALVREGQLLANLDKAPFLAALNQARGNLNRDWASAEQAGRDWQRYKDLVAKAVVSQDDYEQRLTTNATSWQQVKADQAALDSARINLDYCVINSPVTGVAGYQQIKPGNTVNAYSTTLVTINQVQPILVRFSVSEADLAQVRKYYGKTQLAAMASPPHSQAGSEAQGLLTAIDNSVDPQTGMILLQGEFPNADLALWPGQFVQSSVTLAMQKDQILIPSAALFARQDGSFVFVVGADNKAELRPVKPGRVIGSEIIVLEGLKAGERVVTEGLIQVSPGATLNIQESGVGQ